MDRKPNLGKRLHVGDTFRTTTKTMTKDRHGSSRLNKELSGPLITYEVLKPGTRRHFTKGKRRYYCEVLGLIETRTGIYNWYHESARWFQKGRRWWQFTYLVEVLEN
jgi:hypothetical protein